MSFLQGTLALAVDAQTTLAGSALDTTDFASALATRITDLTTLITDIQTLQAGSSNSFTLGQINGQDITVTSADLSNSDKAILALLKAQAGIPTSSMKPGNSGPAATSTPTLTLQQQADAVTQALLSDPTTPQAQAAIQNYQQAYAAQSTVAVQQGVAIGGGMLGVSTGLLGLGLPEEGLALASARASAVMQYITVESGVLIPVIQTATQNTITAVNQDVSALESAAEKVFFAALSQLNGPIAEIVEGSKTIADTVNQQATSPSPTPTPGLSGTWSGSYSQSQVGNRGCTFNNSGTLTLVFNGRSTGNLGTVTETGIQVLNNQTCALQSTEGASGTMSGTSSSTGVSLTLTTDNNIPNPVH